MNSSVESRSHWHGQGGFRNLCAHEAVGEVRPDEHLAIQGDAEGLNPREFLERMGLCRDFSEIARATEEVLRRRLLRLVHDKRVSENTSQRRRGSRAEDR